MPLTRASSNLLSMLQVTRAVKINGALAQFPQHHLGEQVLHALDLLGQGGQPLVDQRLGREPVHFAHHALLQLLHHGGLHRLHIRPAKAGAGLRRGAINVNRNLHHSLAQERVSVSVFVAGWGSFLSYIGSLPHGRDPSGYTALQPCARNPDLGLA